MPSTWNIYIYMKQKIHFSFIRQKLCWHFYGNYDILCGKEDWKKLQKTSLDSLCAICSTSSKLRSLFLSLKLRQQSIRFSSHSMGKQSQTLKPSLLLPNFKPQEPPQFFIFFILALTNILAAVTCKLTLQKKGICVSCTYHIDSTWVFCSRAWIRHSTPTLVMRFSVNL